VRVSVLIVNYRSYEALDVCLATLHAQLGADDEIVVIDHASDAARLARIRAAHPRLRAEGLTGNPGFAAGINRAARHARGDALLFVNPDVVFDQPIVGGMARHLAASPDVGVVGPRLLNADGSVQPSARAFPGVTTLVGGRTTWLTRRFPGNWFSRRNLIGRSATEPTDADWISGACLLTHRALFEQLGGLDERFFLYWEDADYCRRVATAGWRVAHLPGLVARHAGGASSRHDLSAAMRVFHQSAFRYYWKHAGWFGRLAAPVVAAGLWLRGEARARAERRAAARWSRLPPMR
jgi:hypothetical protein